MSIFGFSANSPSNIIRILPPHTSATSYSPYYLICTHPKSRLLHPNDPSHTLPSFTSYSFYISVNTSGEALTPILLPSASLTPHSSLVPSYSPHPLPYHISLIMPPTYPLHYTNRIMVLRCSSWTTASAAIQLPTQSVLLSPSRSHSTNQVQHPASHFPWFHIVPSGGVFEVPKLPPLYTFTAALWGPSWLYAINKSVLVPCAGF